MSFQHELKNEAYKGHAVTDIGSPDYGKVVLPDVETEIKRGLKAPEAVVLRDLPLYIFSEHDSVRELAVPVPNTASKSATSPRLSVN